ncbi:aminopeptidase P family protein [Candidatus Gracilibacteria bacterium]|nr:aminopeptidase P family protein [Candidatus Gracilibacteria bacterium]
MTNERLGRVRAAMAAQGMQVLVLMPDANLQYLSGLTFHRGKRLTLLLIPVDERTPTFVIPALEEHRAAATSRLAANYFPWHDADGPTQALQAAVAAAIGDGPQQIGVEFTALRVMELRALEAALLAVTTVDAMPLLSDVRMVKDADELAAMERAVAIIETALGEGIAQIRAGMSERQLARIIADGILAAGGAGEAFETMIASGPNGASPHHNNSDRGFVAGDLITIDCGAIYNGYLSDITRTVALGEPTEEARRIYELVRAANAAGIAAVKPFVSGETIDRAARNVIEAGGYGAYFVHRTGHGLGIEAHELPNIVMGSTQPLAIGTTFTVEPGIYVPSIGGVRIEDNVVITEDGVRVLTSFPRELLVIETT